MAFRIAIGADHGGFEQKQKLIEHLGAHGHTVIDCGCYSTEPADYPIYGWRVAQHVAGGAADRGIVLCRSGNGIAIAANKHPGVRAGIATSPETAKLAMGHNEANVLVIGCDYITYQPSELVDTWLAAKPEGERHHRRVRQIMGFDRLLQSTLPPDKLALAGHGVWLLEAPGNLWPERTLESLVLFSGVRGLLTRVRYVESAIRNERGNYSARIDRWRAEGLNADEAWMRLKIEDARDAADVLEPIYKGTACDEGYVGVELDGRLNHDENGLVNRVRKLIGEIDRPNVLLTIPGTAEGLRALRTLTARGFSTAVLHLYSPGQVRAAAQAYMAGLQDSLEAGVSIHDVRSVAAVSLPPLAEGIGRALTGEVDRDIGEEQRLGLETLGYPAALELTKKLYKDFRETFLGDGAFGKLARSGGAPQRLLWLDGAEPGELLRPPFPIEDLIAPFTVSCLTTETLTALLDKPRFATEGMLHRVNDTESDPLAELLEEGIDIEELGAALQVRGMEAWQLEQRRLLALLGEKLDRP